MAAPSLARQGSVYDAPPGLQMSGGLHQGTGGHRHQRNSLADQLQNHDVFSLLGPVGSSRPAPTDWTIEEQRVSFNAAASFAVVLVARANQCSLRVVHFADLTAPAGAGAASNSHRAAAAAAASSYREIRCRPELPPDCCRVSVNHEGVVLVSSPTRLFVCRLPKAATVPSAGALGDAGGTRQTFLARRFELGAYYHQQQASGLRQSRGSRREPQQHRGYYDGEDEDDDGDGDGDGDDEHPEHAGGGVRILQADWHPLSPLVHVAVLTSDHYFRLYSLARPAGVPGLASDDSSLLAPVPDAEQEFPLEQLSALHNPRLQSRQDRQRLAEAEAQGLGQGQDGRRPAFVRFCFGSSMPPPEDSAEHPAAGPPNAAACWSMFTVFLLLADGSVASLCPVAPVQCTLRKSVVDGLIRSTQNQLALQSERLAAKPNSKLVKTRIRQAQMALQWLQAVWSDVDSGRPHAGGAAEPRMVRAGPLAALNWPPEATSWVPLVQGPIAVGGGGEDEEQGANTGTGMGADAQAGRQPQHRHTSFALETLRYSPEHPVCLWRVASGGPDATVLQMVLALNPLGPMLAPAAALLEPLRSLMGVIPTLAQHPLQSSLAPFHQILLPSVAAGGPPARLALDWLHGTTIVVALGDLVYVVEAAYVQHILAPLLRQQQPQLPLAASAGDPPPEGLSPQEIEARLLQTFQEVRPQVFCLSFGGGGSDGASAEDPSSSLSPAGGAGAEQACARGFGWLSGGGLGGLGQLAVGVDARFKVRATQPIAGAAVQLLLQSQDLAHDLPEGTAPGALVVVGDAAVAAAQGDAGLGDLGQLGSLGGSEAREAAGPAFAPLVQQFLEKYRAVVLGQAAAVKLPQGITLEELELSDPESFREFLEIAQRFGEVFADLRAIHQQIKGYLAFMLSVVAWQETAAQALEQDYIALCENAVTLRNKQRIAGQLAQAIEGWLGSSVQTLALQEAQLSQAERGFIQEVEIAGREVEAHLPRLEQLRARCTSLLQAVRSVGGAGHGGAAEASVQLQELAGQLALRHQGISACVRKVHFVEEKLEQLQLQSDRYARDKPALKLLWQRQQHQDADE